MPLVSLSKLLRPTLKNSFVSPYPVSLVWVGRSENIFFLTSHQIPYQLNLTVNSPNIGNKTKCTNNAKLLTKNILFKDI